MTCKYPCAPVQVASTVTTYHHVKYSWIDAGAPSAYSWLTMVGKRISRHKSKHDPCNTSISVTVVFADKCQEPANCALLSAESYFIEPNVRVTADCSTMLMQMGVLQPLPGAGDDGSLERPEFRLHPPPSIFLSLSLSLSLSLFVTHHCMSLLSLPLAPFPAEAYSGYRTPAHTWTQLQSPAAGTASDCRPRSEPQSGGRGLTGVRSGSARSRFDRLMHGGRCKRPPPRRRRRRRRRCCCCCYCRRRRRQRPVHNAAPAAASWPTSNRPVTSSSVERVLLRRGIEDQTEL